LWRGWTRGQGRHLSLFFFFSPLPLGIQADDRGGTGHHVLWRFPGSLPQRGYISFSFFSFPLLWCARRVDADGTLSPLFFFFFFVPHQGLLESSREEQLSGRPASDKPHKALPFFFSPRRRKNPPWPAVPFFFFTERGGGRLLPTNSRRSILTPATSDVDEFFSFFPFFPPDKPAGGALSLMHPFPPSLFSFFFSFSLLFGGLRHSTHSAGDYVLALAVTSFTSSFFFSPAAQVTASVFFFFFFFTGRAAGRQHNRRRGFFVFSPEAAPAQAQWSLFFFFLSFLGRDAGR